MKILFSMTLVCCIVLLSACMQNQSQALASQAKETCINLCRQQTQDLSAGPCLSNKIAEGWVCDIAHSPRLAIDNQPENQCPAFGKTANHFVEVDADCNLIKVY